MMMIIGPPGPVIIAIFGNFVIPETNYKEKNYNLLIIAYSDACS